MKISTLWLTGLSGSGKTTVSNALTKKLTDKHIPTYVIDGDVLRSGLCKDLGFNLKDRKENIRRAAEIAKILNDNGIFVICALISPLREDRKIAKMIIGENNFIELYLSTPLEICEKRDVKGLYKKARAGIIEDFTGISFPYEKPTHPWLNIDTSDRAIEEIALFIINKLNAE